MVSAMPSLQLSVTLRTLSNSHNVLLVLTYFIETVVQVLGSDEPSPNLINMNLLAAFY